MDAVFIPPIHAAVPGFDGLALRLQTISLLLVPCYPPRGSFAQSIGSLTPVDSPQDFGMAFLHLVMTHGGILRAVSSFQCFVNGSSYVFVHIFQLLFSDISVQ
jgi:hypothetical protein